MQGKKLPVGIENFEELRREGFCYIDKISLIRDLLNHWGKVNLFTRPRRFGKTLNMSMLKCFFEIGADKTLFDGLAISQETALCETYLGKFPVIFLSLKGVDGLNYADARDMLWEVIRRELRRLQYLLQDDRLPQLEKKSFTGLTAAEAGDAVIQKSLFLLTELLYRYHGQKVILLIDEYDVPLDKAFQHGYYNEMVSLIRGLFGQALKTNEFLHFAVLTGCLRVLKESIFTGLNNFDVNSIVDVEHDEHFGFTEPEAFWINTSGNDLVKRFINKADKTTQDEIERLIAGEAIEKKVRLDLTYNELDKSIENLWSVLFTTGYLTQAGRAVNGIYQLVIPNREVRGVFVLQIQEWFRECVARDEKPMHEFCRAFLKGEPEEIQKRLNVILNRMISILDAKAPDDKKENFYQACCLGYFGVKQTG